MFGSETVKSSAFTSSLSSNSGVFSDIPTTSTNTLLFGTILCSSFDTNYHTNLD